MFTDGTEMRNQHYTPVHGSINSSFKIQAYIRYTRATLDYTPGLWNVLKWAWIQYSSIFLIFYYIVETLKNIVFGQQMIPTWNEKKIQVVSG